MALASSGQLSLNEMHVEAGGTSGTQCSMNDADIRDLISKGSGAQASISEYYGASSQAASYSIAGYSGFYDSKYGIFTLNFTFHSTQARTDFRDNFVSQITYNGNTYNANYIQFNMQSNSTGAGIIRFAAGYDVIAESNQLDWDSYWSTCTLKYGTTTIASWNNNSTDAPDPNNTTRMQLVGKSTQGSYSTAGFSNGASNSWSLTIAS